jgi:Putative Actinobacterial Holin-X, holin superfamily III
MAQQSPSDGEQGQRPVSDVFSQFGDELTQSLRREFEEFRAEAGDRARAGARGAGILAAAAVSGALAAGAALTLPVLGLKRIFGAGGTALIVAAATGGLTAYLAKRGLDELGVPTDAAAERVKEAAQQAVSSP